MPRSQRLDNGPAGPDHRLKLLKRQMYGRAGFDLLRHRTLLAACPRKDWSYDDWVAWAYALRGAFGDEGRELWLEFSAQSDKHQPATASEGMDGCHQGRGQR